MVAREGYQSKYTLPFVAFGWKLQRSVEVSIASVERNFALRQ